MIFCIWRPCYYTVTEKCRALCLCVRMCMRFHSPAACLGFRHKINQPSSFPALLTLCIFSFFRSLLVLRMAFCSGIYFLFHHPILSPPEKWQREGKYFQRLSLAYVPTYCSAASPLPCPRANLKHRWQNVYKSSNTGSEGNVEPAHSTKATFAIPHFLTHH